MKKNIKIVIADDNKDIRETLKDILEGHDYAVETVQNGYELLAYLKENTPQVVILDLVMPEKNGIDILFSIKTISPGIKIIIYTGFQKYQHSIYAKTADKFILKGESPEKLLKTIKKII